MELSRQEYPAIVPSLSPTHASSVLTERIRLINKINSDIADWLSERRRVEDAYVLGLRRLARRPLQDGSAALGVFQTPWQRILAATEILAESHETLSHAIEVDVERPLKEYASRNSDMKSLSTMQQELSNLAKEVESAKKKADKLKDKGPKAAAKNSSAVSAAQEMAQQWESRAPFVFEQLQAVDEHRLNHLRDLLTQYETHESDHIERTRRSTESCLNALLNVQTDEEIRAFMTKVTGGRALVSRTSNAPATTSPPSSRPDPVAVAASTAAGPLPPPPRIHDDASSERSGRSKQDRLGPAPEPVGHMRLGGLKRLGTVMGRRKSVVHHSTGSASSPERKFRSPFTAFRKPEATRNFHPVDMQPNAGDYLAPISSRDDPSLRRPASSPRGTARSESISASHQRPATPNGAVSPDEKTEQEIPSKEANSTDQASTPAQPPKIDVEGYSERPDSLDEISRIQREAAATEEPGLNLTIRDQPIEEDESEAKMALNEVANTLRLKAQQSGLSRGVGTLRGRRDVRNTIFVPNQPGEDSGLGLVPGLVAGPAPVTPSYTPRTVTSPGSHDDHTLSDTTSINSSQTLHSLSGPVSHPDMPEPGLNASIVETVSAWFSDGVVTRSFVVGELALTYNSTVNAPSDPTLVRLNNFHILEKVAANPVLATEAGNSLKGKEKEKEPGDEERKGEYLISLPTIARPTPTVAFKYQVHLDPSNLSAYSPVIFNPVWNLEEFQASVIITYSINPNFVSAMPSTRITLQNLVVTVNLDLSPQEDETTKQPREVARATGAVMYPNTSATFRRKISAVTWKLPELEIGGEGDQRFLARFSTTVSGPRKGKVDAKFDVTNANSGERLGISVQNSTSEQKEKNADDPFADESLVTSNGATSSEHLPTSKTWEEVSTRRKLAAGRYTSVD
ncbi:fes/CIP4 homology domain-containing protein [Histoplasma capsulatum var. duboisii H88]|uniref:Fes/CIP4 homology domain-containing protein n=1 Tax=Ajellomyces capsulatus (strain H88) TaxID=544711 RepID=F0UA98_AJEC8|nr:fes/CIP4 homology domain-containing protein [Histoplasma capsulatum var. duboisii H88]QSS49817.1 fes/CIP4 homology domain-containing protein [Histoplasma capsulatum var. duboisii H88]